MRASSVLIAFLANILPGTMCQRDRTGNVTFELKLSNYRTANGRIGEGEDVYCNTSITLFSPMTCRIRFFINIHLFNGSEINDQTRIISLLDANQRFNDSNLHGQFYTNKWEKLMSGVMSLTITVVHGGVYYNKSHMNEGGTMHGPVVMDKYFVRLKSPSSNKGPLISFGTNQPRSHPLYEHKFGQSALNIDVDHRCTNGNLRGRSCDCKLNMTRDHNLSNEALVCIRNDNDTVHSMGLGYLRCRSQHSHHNHVGSASTEEDPNAFSLCEQCRSSNERDCDSISYHQMRTQTDFRDATIGLGVVLVLVLLLILLLVIFIAITANRRKRSSQKTYKKQPVSETGKAELLPASNYDDQHARAKYEAQREQLAYAALDHPRIPASQSYASAPPRRCSSTSAYV